MIKIGQIYRLKDVNKFHLDQVVEIVRLTPGVVHAVCEDYGTLDRFSGHFGFNVIYRENLIYQLSLRQFKANVAKGNITLEVLETASNIKTLVEMGLILQDDEEAKDL